MVDGIQVLPKTYQIQQMLLMTAESCWIIADHLPINPRPARLLSISFQAGFKPNKMPLKLINICVVDQMMKV